MPLVSYAPYQTPSRAYLIGTLSTEELATLRTLVGEDLHYQQLNKTEVLIDFDRHTDSGKTALVMLTMLNGGAVH